MDKTLLAIKLDQMQTPVASFDRCNFLGCSGHKTNPYLKFFPFPVDDEEACFKWILSTQNGELIGIPADILSKMSICDRHFDDDCFVDSSREMLIPHALPFPLETTDAAYEDIAEIRRNLPSSSTEIIRCTTTPKEEHESYQFNENCPEIAAKIQEVHALLRENKELKEQLREFTVFKYDFNSRKHSAQILSDMQQYPRNNVIFSKPERLIALKYFLNSPEVYNMLLSDDFMLPGLGTVNKWLTMTQLPAGINANTMVLLKTKAAAMCAKDRQCVLLFNEMTVVPEYFADSDMEYVEAGSEDLEQLERTEAYSDQALTIMVQSLYSDWRVPLSYYVSHNLIPSTTLQGIVTEQIEVLLEIGFEVKAICCDQDDVKKLLYGLLGITKASPSFEVKGRVIMGLYDPSGLMRIIRKLLQEEDIVVTNQGRRISWKDIVDTFELDNDSHVRHFVPGIAAQSHYQNIDLAYKQIFTQDFAHAVRAASKTKELQSETAMQTAAFLSIITNIFVSLTTGQLPDTELTLRQGILFLDGIPMDAEKNSCFESLSMTMRAILKMWYANRAEYPVLETGRLTLQTLDDLYSKIHEDLEYDEATVREFRMSLEQLKTNMFMRALKKADCEEEDFMFGFNFAMKNCYYNVYMGRDKGR